MPDPAPTGLYHVYDGAEGLLYIGVSKHFGIRWQQHAQKQPWWNERRRMTVDFYDDREEALDAEALAIFTEQPKYNVLHRKQAQRLKRLQRAEVTNKRRADVLVLLGPNSQLSTAIGKSGWVVLFSPGWRPPVFQAGGRVFSRRGGG